ncbi:hypothetical protein ACTI_53720 [Actinoplanes sp. OR16]|uniref:hypothetical protein n=1 Tax=Actinoplanes sp. OR16 TaxID=946334 RepID=UPI000F70170A|nr:hypothetical protein [Actinoplanes sp. OR16]BBH68687.1 hypothetical protein ACTI_53720 [Actinoplanes sp. OR16]
MANDELIVWRAKHDDRDHAWRNAGGLLLASFFPTVLIGCAGALDIALLSLAIFTPLAAVFAVREIVKDRKAVVAIELRNNEFTLIRPDGARTVYPARQIDRIDVLRTMYSSEPDVIQLKLHVGDRVERTRNGPAELPEGWEEAITVAEVAVHTITKYKRD